MKFRISMFAGTVGLCLSFWGGAFAEERDLIPVQDFGIQSHRSLVEQVRAECEAEAEAIVSEVEEAARKEGADELHFTWTERENEPQKTGTAEEFADSFIRACMKAELEPNTVPPPRTPV